MSKADYVRAQRQTREHECHWPGCGKQVPPAMWGCKKHWFMLPASLRARIWRAYRPGQEKDLDVSDEYFAVAREVQRWIATNSPGGEGQ
jgi:hypothetical protein